MSREPTPVLLPRKFYGWRSLVSYSPQGRKESDMTERLHFKKKKKCQGKLVSKFPFLCFEAC